MALNKQAISLNFGKGLDTKSDPYQLQLGNFLTLQNMVFSSTNRWTKRNGFAEITTLPNANQTTLTSLNGNLVATGSNLYSYSAETDQWINKGIVQPVSVQTQTVVRNATSQSGPDAASTAAGLTCVVYEDNNVAYYQIVDNNSGEQVISRVSLGANSSVPRVFICSEYYIVTFQRVITANTHLSYVAIPVAMPGSPLSVQDFATGLKANSGYDGVVANNNLYVGWATSANQVQIAVLTSTLVLAAPTTLGSHTADLMSLAADFSSATPNIWMTFWDSSSTNGFTIIYNANLLPVHSAVQTITGKVLATLTSVVTNSVLTLVYEINNTYGVGPISSVRTDYLVTNTLTQSGTLGTPKTTLRSVGLASKPFVSTTGTIYVMAAYGEQAQPTYFLIDLNGNIYLRLAYSNGGGYENSQVLPSVYASGNTFVLPYLYKDFITSINKSTNLANGTQTSAIYSQTGINLATIDINTTAQHSSEIAGALHLTGGMVWEYDSVAPTELGFQVWPENTGSSSVQSGGGLAAELYYYQFTYEWTDAQGNFHRSAPSIPLLSDLTKVAPHGVTFTGTGKTGEVLLSISSLAGLNVGQTIVDVTKPANLTTGTKITALGSVFQATFLTSAPQMTVLDTTGLYVGQTISDTSVTAAIAPGTTITGISGTTVNISANPLLNSASSPGDTMLATGGPTPTITINQPVPAASATAQSVAHFASGTNVITVASVTGFSAGQTIVDATTPANIPSGTTITAVGLNTLTLSANTTAAATADTVLVPGTFSGDTLAATSVSTVANFTANSYVLNVSTTAGFQVGQRVTDATTPGNIPTGSTITAIGSGTITISQLTTAAASADVILTSDILSNTLYVPTLRLTYKVTPNPVRIVGYRWSVNQQNYYQFTSISNPNINNPNVDYITITDTLSDGAILGNALIYTTGGVLENIAPPACIDTALFSNRLFLIDAEDRNLLWFSKQVIEATPVEMTDLLTIFVAPTSGAQGSTGVMTALFPMDDKLIIFKKDAMYYINGTGPDNTGANSNFSDPVFIAGAIGCENPSSIVLIPSGLMFQSDKGIWLLGRDLQTSYIGAPVEEFNGQTVVSAQTIPGTNQVRFVLDNEVTLMYDYFQNQWGTFSNLHAISSTLYQGYQTYLNAFGQVFQETPGTWQDGSSPVLMSLTTGWINIAGLQGFERFYQAYLLGTYNSPFKLNVGMAYDYNPAQTQQTTVVPSNYTAPWGGEAVWGSGGPWGGGGQVFEARVFPQQQKCESFQISIQEIYDNSYPMNSGQGLTLSGLNLIVGTKKGYRTQSAGKSFG